MTTTPSTPHSPNFIEAFKSHPASVGETYWSHMAFAFGFGLQMIGVGFAAILHGLVPPLFVNTGSSFIKAMHAKLTQRNN